MPAATPHAENPPRRVILFSGHMVDAPGRAQPRFPPELAAVAGQRIAAALAELDAGPGDLGLTQGAEFIERSVRPVCEGEDWVARYRRVAGRLASPPQAMPPGGGAGTPGCDEDDNPFERCNRWLLDTALACGGERVWLLCLWDGQGGDGAGGTAHMVREVQRRNGHVIHIDTRQLWQESAS